MNYKTVPAGTCWKNGQGPGLPVSRSVRSSPKSKRRWLAWCLSVLDKKNYFIYLYECTRTYKHRKKRIDLAHTVTIWSNSNRHFNFCCIHKTLLCECDKPNFHFASNVPRWTIRLEWMCSRADAIWMKNLHMACSVISLLLRWQLSIAIVRCKREKRKHRKYHNDQVK